jgi:hypothetical protein
MILLIHRIKKPKRKLDIMLPWIISKWSWKSFAVGASAALFGGTIARPALVHVVKAGMDASDYASGTFAQAKVEVAKLRQEAAGLRGAAAPAGYSDLISEIQKLREEIAAAKGNFGKA